MTSLVAQQLGQHLPGIVDTRGEEVQWVTPGGRHAQVFCDQNVLASIWTHNDNSTFPREYNGKNLYDAARAIRKQAFDIAFSNAFEPLDQLRGKKFAVSNVFPTQAQDGIIIRLTALELNIPCLELKRTTDYPAQVRPLHGAFYPQPELTREIICDIWGGEEQMEQWYDTGVLAFINDPDSDLIID